MPTGLLQLLVLRKHIARSGWVLASYLGWAVRYAGETSISQDKAYAIDVDNQGSIIVTGESGIGSNIDYVTIKYSQNTDLSEYHNRPVSKYSITPNPFRNAVMLNLPAHTNAHIFIYDCSGALVQELQCRGSVQWNPQVSLPAGVYFIHIETPQGDIIRKVVKLKLLRSLTLPRSYYNIVKREDMVCGG